MTGFFDRWLESEDLAEEFHALKYLIVREQLLLNAQGELQLWLKERQLKDLASLVSLADHNLETHRGKDKDNEKNHQTKKQQFSSSCTSGDKYFVELKDRKCYSCGEMGHIAPKCPNR